MKRGTLRHRKLIRLAGELGIQPLFAAGILEGLWHWAAETCPTGSLQDATPEEIAAGIGYQGDCEALISALVTAGWLDKMRANSRTNMRDCAQTARTTRANCAHVLCIHDWHEHADYDVHATVARKRMLFHNGQVPKLSKLRPDERKEAEEFYANTLRIRNEYATNRALPKPSRSRSHSLNQAEAETSQAPPAGEPPAASPQPAQEPAQPPADSFSPPDGISGFASNGNGETGKASQPANAKLTPIGFSTAISKALGTLGVSPQQFASNDTTFKRAAAHVSQGHIGPPGEALVLCITQAQRIRADPTTRNGAAKWTDWFKSQLTRHGFQWTGTTTPQGAGAAK